MIARRDRPEPRGARARLRLIALATVLAAMSGHAAADAGRDAASLGDLSIEQLMNESVTSVSMKEQSRFDAAAAVAVVSSDDLRRGGATTVADALRTIPGLNVASVNASDWAISARGFNNLYANKLLVLVDGRSVYTPVFGGVYWDLQQMVLEDVDRIEVIRGPGATVWGANAVNGVINIVTREASETQGTWVEAGGGDVRRTVAGARHGGRLGEDTWYRAFAGYRNTAGFPRADGSDAGDHWEGGQAGFRIDSDLAVGSHLTWQADTTLLSLAEGTSRAANANTLARWSRQWGAGSSLQVQGYFDHVYRYDSQRNRSTVDTIDLALHHRFAASANNDLIWGLGYRYVASVNEQTSPFAQMRNGNFDLQLASGFVQNEFEWLPDRLRLTAGVKVEYHDYTGVEIQPSVRLSFKPEADQTLWAAVSRAVRTPSAVEGSDLAAISYGAPFTGPGGGQYVPTVVGNSGLDSEVLWAYELGWRIRPAEQLSFDLAMFYNDYDRLIAIGNITAFNPGTPVGTAEIPFTNDRSGATHGGELAATYAATDAWRLTAAYSLLLMQISGPAAVDPTDPEDGSPRHQASLRSSQGLGAHGDVDVQLRYVDAITTVPAYVTADLRLAWRPAAGLELSLVGQNLLDPQHPEQAGQAFAIASEVPRGVYAKLAWNF